MHDDNHAADVVRLREILGCMDYGELCDIIRRSIAGLSFEQADAAIVDLFNEAQIASEVILESAGYTDWDDEKK